MAKYGARYLRFAKFATSNPEPANSLPNYAAPISIPNLSKVTDNPKFSTGKAYGDDHLTEQVSEFQEVEVNVENSGIANAVLADVYGATVNVDGELTFNDGDTAPYGGLGFISPDITDGTRKFVGIFYPKVKGTVQGEDFEGKKDNITFSNTKMSFLGERCANGAWKKKSPSMATEALAQAWVDGCLGVTSGGN